MMLRENVSRKCVNFYFVSGNDDARGTTHFWPTALTKFVLANFLQPTEVSSHIMMLLYSKLQVVSYIILPPIYPYLPNDASASSLFRWSIPNNAGNAPFDARVAGIVG
eukprot:scaffold34611_cov184-Amphora_coffeaeformis.AAC.10